MYKATEMIYCCCFRKKFNFILKTSFRRFQQHFSGRKIIQIILFIKLEVNGIWVWFTNRGTSSLSDFTTGIRYRVYCAFSKVQKLKHLTQMPKKLKYMCPLLSESSEEIWNFLQRENKCIWVRVTLNNSKF